MIYKLTSSKEIISKVYRDLNLRDANRWQDMIEWIGEGLEAIGAFPQLVRRVEDITIDEYKACLPCDFYKIQQVMFNGLQLLPLNATLANTFDPQDASQDYLSQDIDTVTLANNVRKGNYGYYIEDCYIKTNFRDGEITLAYMGFPVDDDGFPKVPDDYYYKEALLAYIIKKLKYPEYITGAIPQYIWKDIEMNWEYKCGQARANANMPDLPMLESMKNIWVRMIPNINESSNFFNDLGSPYNPNTM